jgi:hypothetical protein
MSFVIHSRSGPRLIRLALRLALVMVLAVLATAGVAAACPAQPTTTPFTQWGDTNSYFPVPGGSFEGPTTSWRLTNAALTPGNEPFYVNSPSDSQSLTINGGGRAISPVFCIDNTMTSVRFFAVESAPGSDLRVRLVAWTSSQAGMNVIGDLADGSMPSWGPSAALSLNPGFTIPDGQTANAALVFEVPQSGGSWQIDDVYFDPWRTG